MLEENSSYGGRTTLELLHNQSHDSSLPMDHEYMHLGLFTADTQWQVSVTAAFCNSAEINLYDQSIASVDLHPLALFSVMWGRLTVYFRRLCKAFTDTLWSVWLTSSPPSMVLRWKDNNCLQSNIEGWTPKWTQLFFLLITAHFNN